MLSIFGMFSPGWLQASVEPVGNMSAFLVCPCNAVTLAPRCLQEILIQQWPRAWASFSQGRGCRNALSQVQVTPAFSGLCTQIVAVVRDVGVRRTWWRAGLRDHGWRLCTWPSWSISPSVSLPEAAQLTAVLAPWDGSALWLGWLQGRAVLSRAG